MYGKWLNSTINGMRNIRRWEGRQKIIMVNDSEHSFNVALISEALCRVEKEIYNHEINVLEVLQRALMHDTSEILIGDIKSGVKKKTVAMKNALEEIEHQLYEEELEPMIPESWREDYKSYILDPKQGKKTIEGKIIAVADNIDALNEVIQEVKLGNNTFKPYLEIIANDILNIDLDAGKHFIKYCLADFELPIEMYGERVVNFINTYNI